MKQACTAPDILFSLYLCFNVCIIRIFLCSYMWEQATVASITLVSVVVCWTANCSFVKRCDYTLCWRHNGRDGVSNDQPHDCLLNRLFRHRSKETAKLRVTGLCVGTSPVTGEFPAQIASNAEYVSIWWRHHESNPAKNYIIGTAAASKGNSIHWGWVTHLSHSQLILYGFS